MIEQVHEIINALKRPATLADIAKRAQLSAVETVKWRSTNARPAASCIEPSLVCVMS